MTPRPRTTALLLLAALLCLAAPALAARQALALFPPEIVPAGTDNALRPAVTVLEQTLKEKLADRFDVRPAGEGTASATDDTRRRKARTLGASYVFTGNLSRIGKTVTLDVTIAPVEEPGKGRTVVVSGALENPSALTPQDLALFRRLGTRSGPQDEIHLLRRRAGGGGRLREEYPEALRDDHPQRLDPRRHGVHRVLRHRPRREDGIRRRLRRRDRRLPRGGGRAARKGPDPRRRPGALPRGRRRRHPERGGRHHRRPICGRKGALRHLAVRREGVPEDLLRPAVLPAHGRPGPGRDRPPRAGVRSRRRFSRDRSSGSPSNGTERPR